VVGVDRAPGGIDQPDPFIGGFDDGPVAFFALPQRFRGPFPLADVGHRGQPAEGLAAFPAQRRGAHQYVEPLPAAALEAELEAFRRGFAAQDRRECGPDPVVPFRRPVEERRQPGEQLGFAPTHHAAEFGADVQLAAVGTGNGHTAAGRFLESPPEGTVRPGLESF
jgi:hypothetical protein